MVDLQAEQDLRALDAEVARWVFGKQPCDEWHMWHAAMGSWSPNGDHDANAHNCYPSYCPIQYSQLIQAAWLVVEKMREMGHDFSLWNSRSGTDNDWCVNVDGDTFFAYAETAPLAICRAALAAFGE